MRDDESQRPEGDSGRRGAAVSAQQRETKRMNREVLRASGELKGQKARGWTERLLTRTTSGAIYAIVILVCLYLGDVSTGFLVAMMSWLCCSEFYRMMRMCGRMPNELLGLAAAVAFPLSALISLNALLVVGVVFLTSVGWWYVATLRASISDVAVTVFGPVYTGLTLATLVIIRLSDPGNNGALLTFMVMASVWLTDALAYVFGSRFGRHKLAPKVSPNKSWEGAYGGVVGTFIPWAILAFMQVKGITWPIAIIATALVSLSAVIGDLFESRIKRGSGVKDSGNLMPGHGGLLDRSDSMLFGAAVAFLVLRMGGIL